MGFKLAMKLKTRRMKKCGLESADIRLLKFQWMVAIFTMTMLLSLNRKRPGTLFR